MPRRDRKEHDVTDLDPITAQVVRDSFEFISEEMSRVVERSAVHPLFQEVHDYSTGVFYYDGRDVSLIARATAMPVHIFASVESVKAIVAAFADDIHDGDVFLLNDPYAGGSHQADWTMMKPIVLPGGELVIPSVRAHMSDFGGVAPGGYYPDAREVWQEGYRIAPVRLYERGELRRDLWDLILGNSRLTQTLTGDVMAIVGGCNVGARRAEALVDKYGGDVVKAAIVASMDYAERRFVEEVRAWPDGVYRGESVLDHDSGGTYDVTVRAENSEGWSLPSDSVSVEVVDGSVDTPIVSVTGELKAGGTIKISGTGFADETAYAVELRSTPQPLGSVTSDADGAFRLEATIPADITAGEHTVVVMRGGVDIASARVLIAAADPGAGGDPAGPGGLSATGMDADWVLMVGGLALLLLVAGAVALTVRRGRTDN
jgi:hypothetical protein